MSSNQPLELRILTGAHSGARAQLSSGKEYVLGADAGCDFVLSDAGLMDRHARLQSEGGGWRLHWLPGAPGDGPPAPVELGSGLAVALGPVIIAVEAQGSPWPTLEQLVLVQTTAGEAVPQAPAEDAPTPGSLANVLQEGGGAPSRSRWRGPWSGRSTLLLAAGMAAMLSAGAFVAWPGDEPASLKAVSDAAPMPPPAAPALQAPPGQRLAIEKMLAELGLSQRVVIEQAGANWLVRANYVDDAAAEKLANAVTRIQPRPLLRISSELDLPQDVADALARIARDVPGTVRLINLGDARFRLEGVMPSVRERDALLAALREALPDVRGWDAAISVPQEAADALLAELRAAGWDVSGEWQSGTFTMQARMQQAQLPQWERALAQSVAKKGIPIKATVAFDAPSQARRLAAAGLPFEVRGVVGSEQPYVVLAGGDRLLVDGTHRGWRLVAIEAQRITFDNGNRRASVPR